MSSNFQYQVGGSLALENTAYVERQCDRDLLEHLKVGKYCFVFNSRQMGKSSLRVRTMQRLQQEGFVCAVIDPQSRGTTLKEEQWYAGTIKRLIGDLRLEEVINFSQWWKDLEKQSISAVERFDYFIEQILLRYISQKIVIFIEEVDNLLSLKFDTDGFFILVRSLYERRAEKSEYQRLTFAFLGVATPSDLIRGKGSSAFNIGYAVAMSGFTLEEAKPLIDGLADQFSDREAVLVEILKWTGGQPFLTQKLLTLVAAESQLGENSAEKMVQKIVIEKVIENWEVQDIPPHLKTIRDRILQSDEKGRGRLLGLYQQVLDDGIPADESYDQMQLRLTGLTVKRDGRLIIYNPIYGSVFNQTWVSRALGDLRPSFYGSAFQAWQESDEQKESFLLRGQALVEAEAWAKGKRLSDEDEQFLRDSREVEKRAITLSLEAERMTREASEQVNETLHRANKIAKQRIKIGSFVLLGTLIAAGITVSGAWISVADAYRKIVNADIKLKTVNAKVKFLDNRGLEFILLALDAGYRLRQVNERSQEWQELRQDILPILQQAAYRVPEHNRLQGHTGVVNSANFSPDGSKIVTASDDKTVRIWDTKGNQLIKIKGHTDSIKSASFSPDGSKIVTASEDKTARVWDLKGNQITKLQGHTGYIWSVSFSPDGSKIVTASDDNTARLWDLQGNQIVSIRGHTGVVRSANFSLDGNTIVTASSDNTARLWDLQGNQISELRGHTNSVRSASFSPDGNKIVTASWDNTVRLWDLKGNQISEFQGHTGYVSSANFSSDGSKIVTASDDNTARLWDLKGNQILEIKGHTSIVRSANFSPDTNSIITASDDNTARIWNLKGNQILEIKEHTGVVRSANFSPDGNRIVTASDDKTARLWDLQGNQIINIRGHTSAVRSASFSPDGNRIVTASEDQTARLWDLQGNQILEIKGHTGTVYSASFSPDGNRIVTASDDKTARLWDLKGNQVLEIKGHTGIIKSASFSPDGSKIVTASFDKTARVWDLKGNQITELKGHTSYVSSASFSSDGQKIVTASSDNTVRVWDLKGNQLSEIKGLTSIVWNANFSPDGSKIVTASEDKTVRIWDSKGNQIAEVKGHTSAIRSVSFSPDGNKIVTASFDQTARVWDVNFESDFDRLLSLGCEKLYDYLTTNPNVTDNDRQMCGIAPRAR